MRIFFSLNKKQLKKKNFAYTCSVRKKRGEKRRSRIRNKEYFLRVCPDWQTTEHKIGRSDRYELRPGVQLSLTTR